MNAPTVIDEAQVATRTNPWHALLAAIQFLTRIPVPSIHYTTRTLADALPYFPLVGLALGALAGGLNTLLVAHLSRTLAALFVVMATILITGALHEDGLADCADAFGSRHSRQRTLEILHDSRIGTYGAVALTLSLAARVLLIAALPLGRVMPMLIAASVLSRWSSLPLTLLPPARPDGGQGMKVAQRTSHPGLIIATIFALAIVIYSLRVAAIAPVLAACITTALSAWFYYRRIGGTTGDCFGATNQLVEIAVLTCGAWLL
jgi:adenosylcobinamide-GDP ribazoletransferase